MEENRKRWLLLQANYDPLTGEGLEELTGEKRVLLEIPDFAAPCQLVPREMVMWWLTISLRLTRGQTISRPT